MVRDAGAIINENLMRMAENLSLIERFTFGSGPLKNLTTKEMHTIALIAALGLPKMSDLAGRGHVTLGTMTVMINKLVKKGFVRRIRDDDDRRVVRVGLTASGRKADRAHAKLHQDVIEGILGVLSEEEQEQLANLITKITSSLGR
jgi:DNA-binding MarR family transcriptional regulator